MKTLQTHIDEVMDWFDFDKVHKYMESVGWAWHSIGVPDKAELRKTVREEMKKLYNLPKKDPINHHSYCSGGFEIIYYWGKDDEGPWDHYDVKFIITSWYTGE